MTDPIAAFRRDIDAIDDRIVELLEQRATLAGRMFTAKEKAGQPVFDPQREEEIFHRIRKQSAGEFPERALHVVFAEIVSACRNLRAAPRIGLLGEKFGWVQDAALARFGSSSGLSPLETGEELLDSLRRGDIGLGFFPMTTGGDLHLLLEAFMGGTIRIVAETRSLQRFSLFSPDQTDLPEITELFVTREVMTLLRQWIISLSVPMRITICRSMVEVVENLVEGRQVAGILPEHVAKTLEGNVIRAGLEPVGGGPVRYLTISDHDLPFTAGNKASILCHLSEEPEALPGVLAPLTWARCPLRGIEIFRFHQKAWKELYLIDFVVPDTEADYRKVLEAMAPKCLLFKALGQYPVADTNA